MEHVAKKRKAEENGSSAAVAASSAEGDGPKLLPADIRRLLEPFSKDQLVDALQDAACLSADVLDAVRSLADADASARRLFVRGLGWDTTSDGLRAAFSAFGDVQEAIVIVNKITGRSKGYGFVTFRHADGALLALKEPSKLIEGRMTVAQLSVAGSATAAALPYPDASQRKIYVGGVPEEMPAERLLQHFSQFGEIEEGPIGYDKVTGKSKGFALIVYKTAEGASASLAEPTKIDGYTLACRYARGGGLVPGSGACTAAGQGAAPGLFDQIGAMSSIGGVGSETGLQALQYSLSSNLPSSMVGASRFADVGIEAPSSPGRGALGGGYFGFSKYDEIRRFEAPSSPGRGALGSGYSGLSKYDETGRGVGFGTGGYDGFGYGGGAHHQLGSSRILSGENFGYPSSEALRGVRQPPPGPSPDFRIPPRGGMYQRAMPPPYY